MGYGKVQSPSTLHPSTHFFMLTLSTLVSWSASALGEEKGESDAFLWDEPSGKCSLLFHTVLLVPLLQGKVCYCDLVLVTSSYVCLLVIQCVWGYTTWRDIKMRTYSKYIEDSYHYISLPKPPETVVSLLGQYMESVVKCLRENKLKPSTDKTAVMLVNKTETLATRLGEGRIEFDYLCKEVKIPQFC